MIVVVLWSYCGVVVVVGCLLSTSAKYLINSIALEFFLITEIFIIY